MIVNGDDGTTSIADTCMELTVKIEAEQSVLPDICLAVNHMAVIGQFFDFHQQGDSLVARGMIEIALAVKATT